MMGKKIGVTGATGFIGRHLINALRSEGYDLILFEGDICNPDDVNEFVLNCPIIYHLAAKNRGPKDEIQRVNIEGGQNIASAAARYGNHLLIFASSNQIRRDPNSPYSISKLSTEDAFTKIAGTNGCSTIIFRIPNVYGPGSRPFYNSVIATFCWYDANGMGDQMPIIGDGQQRTDYVAVNKVIDTLLGAIDFNGTLKTVDVVGEVFSVRELVEIIRDPEKRRNYPSLQAEWEFFAYPRPLPQKAVGLYPIHNSASGTFQELIHDDETTFGQLSLCTISVECERGGHYHTYKEEWFCVIQGKMALDFYTTEGQYLQTQLLTARHPRFVHIPLNYLHVVRNIGDEVVKFLIVCDEKFDPNNPDTYIYRKK